MTVLAPRLGEGRNHGQFAGNGPEAWGLVEALERAEALVDGVAGGTGARPTDP